MVQIEVAQPKDRFVAAAIDFVPPFLLFLLFAIMGAAGLATVTALVGSIYLVFRDVIGNGQSIGKRFRDLQVVDADTDRVPDTMALILRNIGFGVPGLNAIYAIVEGVRVVRQEQGLRFGDVFAETGVVRVPKTEREKLLAKPEPKKPRERITGERPAVTADGELGTGSGAKAPTMPQDTVPGSPDMKPAATAAPAAPAKKAPAPIDLPPEAPKAAAPAAKPAAPPATTPPKPAAAAAPKPGTPAPPKPAAAPGGPAPLPNVPGVSMSDDDPLKKLIEKAGAKGQ